MNSRLRIITAISSFYKYMNLKLRSNNKINVFVICLLLSSSFWMLNILSKEFTFIINYNIHVENLDEQEIIINKIPSFIKFEIKGIGYNLINVKKKYSHKDFPINLKSLSWTSYEKHQKGVFNVKKILSKLKSELDAKVKITNLSQDSIIFLKDFMNKKKVPIKPNIAKKSIFLTYKNNIKLNPDSITIYGNIKDLKKIYFIKTQKTNVPLKSGIHKLKTTLKEPKNIKIKDKKIQLIIELEETTQKTLEIPIQIKNQKLNQKIKIFPSKVSINFLVGMSYYDRILPNNIIAYVDCHDLDFLPNRLNVYTKSKKDNLHIINVNPKRVNYTIK